MRHSICSFQYVLFYQGKYRHLVLFQNHKPLTSHQEVDIGLAPDLGTLSYLPKITGNHSLVRELTYTSRFFSAEEADKIGLVSKVVQGGRDEVTAAALELAKTIASKSPVAVAGAKHLITHARDHTYVITTPLTSLAVTKIFNRVAENLQYTAAWNGAALMTEVSTSTHKTVGRFDD